MRNLRFVLEDLNDRGRAVEPNRLSPTGAGFTGLEALLQYFFVQSQAINIYDSKGYLLKLGLLVNECSQYTNAQTIIDNPERTAHCKQWLGPNQPGINAGQVPSSPRTGPRSTADRPGAPHAGTPAAAESPGAQGAPAPASPLPRAKDLLDKVLPPSVDRQAAAGAAQAPRLASSDASDRNLLDYLLGP